MSAGLVVEKNTDIVLVHQIRQRRGSCPGFVIRLKSSCDNVIHKNLLNCPSAKLPSCWNLFIVLLRRDPCVFALIPISRRMIGAYMERFCTAFHTGAAPSQARATLYEPLLYLSTFTV